MSQHAPVNLFVTLPLKPEEKAKLLQTMLENAAQSRREAGCISFDVFLPEEGGNTIYLFERWKSQAALDQHMTRPHLLKVQEGLKTALAGAAATFRLAEIPPSGASNRTPVADPATSRNVIVVFKIKPDQKEAFLAALTEVIPQARSAPGNHTFELYRDESDPNTLVLLERWVNVQAHEAHLAQAYSKKLDGIVPGTLAQPVDRHLLKDVAGK